MEDVNLWVRGIHNSMKIKPQLYLMIPQYILLWSQIFVDSAFSKHASLFIQSLSVFLHFLISSK